MSLRYNKSLFAGILISCFTLVACKKDDASQPLQSGVYIADKAGEYSSVRLFAQTGEIKDQNLIDSYKVKYAKDLNPVNSGGAILDTLTVIDANNAQNGYLNFAVSKVDGYYQFKSKDTLVAFGMLDLLTYDLVKYKPYYYQIFVPASTGIGVRNWLVQDHYASATSNELVFPMVNIVRFASRYANSSFYFSYRTYKLNNVLRDKPLLNALGDDTLLIQTFNVHYKR